MLTIVGASARAAAFSAVRAGFSVHAADLFADVDLCRVSTAVRVAEYPEGLARAIARGHSGGWMYTGGLENHPALIDGWARHRALWGNAAGVLERIREPRLVADALRRAALCAPDVSVDNAEVPRDGTWLVKRLRSSGGLHVSEWTRESPSDLPPDCYLQHFVEGLACSAVYLAACGEAVLVGVTRQLVGAPWTGASGLRYCGSVGPLALTGDVEEQFRRIGPALAREFELLGLFGVDAVINAGGVWTIEVNPRYTASIEVIERATGFHAIAGHVEACRSGRLPTPPASDFRERHAKAILFATRRITIPASARDLAVAAAAEPWPEVADIPAPHTTIEAGWPIVTVFDRGHSEHEAIESLRRRAAVVRLALGA